MSKHDVQKRFVLFGLMGYMLLWGHVLTAQQLQIGEWRTFFPYNNSFSVTNANGIIYMTNELGLIEIDPATLQYKTYEKEDGLLQIGPAILAYHPNHKALIMGYQDGFLTVYQEGEFTGISDIRDFQTLPLDKRINRIRIKDDQRILVVANYGFSELDLPSKRFLFTTFTTPIEARDVLYHDSTYYLATTKGLYTYDLRQGQLVQSFADWEKVSIDQLSISDANCQGIAEYDGQLWLGCNGALFVYQNGKWELYREWPNYQIIAMESQDSGLLLTLTCVYNCNRDAVIIVTKDSTYRLPEPCVKKPLNAVFDPYGRVWLADRYRLIRYVTPRQNSCTDFYINSPFSANATDIAFDHQGRVLIATGGHDEVWTYLWRKDGLLLYDGQYWSRISSENTPELDDHLFYDIYKIAVHPQTGHIFLGSFLSGVLEMSPDGSIVQFYDKSNSALQGTVGDEERIRIADLVFDNANNLWITNYLAPKPLVKYGADGSWKAYGNSRAGTFFSELTISDEGYIWIATPPTDKARGVVVFDEGDPDIEGDERWRIYSSSNSNLPDNAVYDIERDLDGTIWVCTSLGVLTFDITDVFSPQAATYGGDRRIVTVNDIPEYLLNYEIVRCMAVDGANRKWFGTDNGVFVLDPYGEVLLAHYNVDNAPLPDNRILAINIHPERDIVYIATAKGVIAFRTDASFSGKYFDSSLEIFPNPYLPDQHPYLAIRGLAANATVKITDLEGNLIYLTTANGGTALWNGHDMDDQPVPSGVYLIFASRYDEFSPLRGATASFLLIR